MEATLKGPVVPWQFCPGVASTRPCFPKASSLPYCLLLLSVWRTPVFFSVAPWWLLRTCQHLSLLIFDFLLNAEMDKFLLIFSWQFLLSGMQNLLTYFLILYSDWPVFRSAGNLCLQIAVFIFHKSTTSLVSNFLTLVWYSESQTEFGDLFGFVLPSFLSS